MLFLCVSYVIVKVHSNLLSSFCVREYQSSIHPYSQTRCCKYFKQLATALCSNWDWSLILELKMACMFRRHSSGFQFKLNLLAVRWIYAIPV